MKAEIFSRMKEEVGRKNRISAIKGVGEAWPQGTLGVGKENPY